VITDNTTKQLSIQTFDAWTGKELNTSHTDSDMMVKMQLSVGKIDVDLRPTEIIDGKRFIFPAEAKWRCVEPNGVVYWSEQRLKKYCDEDTKEPLGWGANKHPIHYTNENGYLRTVTQKLEPGMWLHSWTRIPRQENRSKRLFLDLD
jgi:hypothetical protein